MTRIFKSGKELKGNKNSGRKTAREEAERILKLDLANAIHNEQLEHIKNTPVAERKHESYSTPFN
jgi:hypothetical protein